MAVQIYRCDATTSAWTPVAPRADLYDDRGRLIGTHFARPTWQARDGSYVTAALGRGQRRPERHRLAAARDAHARRRCRRGPTGRHHVHPARRHRRGAAPAKAECDVPDEIAEVAYTADYYFWKAIEN